MANGKRIFGTVAFIIALLLTLLFVFVLFAKSHNDTDVPFVNDLSDFALYVGVGVGLMAMLLFLTILIRSSDERRNIRLEEEDERRRREEEERARAFEQTLEEPENLGKGPEITVYNLAGIPHMFHAYDRMNRRSKVAPYTFPRTVQDAIYSTQYLDVGRGVTLKLRTLIAGPKDGTKKELANLHLKRAAVNIDPKAVDEPWRSRLLGNEPEPTAAQSSATDTSKPTGREFVAELDSHLVRNGAGRKPSRAYYDYSGDIHDVEDVEGIGRIYGDKLREAGVHTTARLAYEDPEELAERVGVPRKTVETWQAMGELIKVSGIGPQYAEALARAGIQGIADLKRRKAESIADQVNAYLDSIETNVLGQSITAKRVEGWQKACAKMKRLRLQVPEK